MATNQGTIARLMDPSLPNSTRHAALRDFAIKFGWRPSDELLEYPGLEQFSNGHLVVEHGLENTAVITFLKATHPFQSLSESCRKHMLAISYNHLVDWHLFPDQEGVTTVFNRADPLAPKRMSAYEDPDIWRADAFERITRMRPNPNLKNLDNALIETIAIWKRALAAEVGTDVVSTDALSAFFNAILFVRAFEDFRRFETPNEKRALLDTWQSLSAESTTVRSCLKVCLNSLGAKDIPASVLDLDQLDVFDLLDSDTVDWVFRDFYQNRFAPYHYDFSLMSKHALSRIYEKYVALLRTPDSVQLRLFAELPEEENTATLGTVYTPQYIARFFSRFLKDNLTPRVFRELSVADPACGSGIFLRTILEMQCDPFFSENITADAVSRTFANVTGIDWDANACHATRLSLALLHLVLTGHFPDALRIEHAETIEYYSQHKDLKNSCDAVIANPPFIKWDHMSEELRSRVATFMEEYSRGKTDMFLAHLRVGMEMVKPGGYCLYVLPHSFLIGRNAATLREVVARDFWVRCLVDLSDVPVFQGVGSYVVLLIVQKKQKTPAEIPRATIVRCREFVGQALTDVIEGKSVSTEFYQVYEVPQDRFCGSEWDILPPVDAALHRKLNKFRRLSEFLTVREGFVTGADDVFIVDRNLVPKGEEAVYVSYLSDREMERYTVPSETARSVFYPYVGDNKVTDQQLRKEFPKTWKYLKRYEQQLSTRKSVVRGDVQWWCPERPRVPGNMMRPKLVSPHLIVLPRFSLDANGQFAVSRCPLMYPRDEGNDEELLSYFLAILNSPISMAQIARLSHKYSRGYAMLEPKTLKAMSVPDPATVPVGIMRRIQSLVSKRMENTSAYVEHEIDMIVADLFGLTAGERERIGMED